MSRIPPQDDGVLWQDRRRILGLPLTFTRYEIRGGRFITRTGFLNTNTNELLLYRILDIRLERTLLQRICRVGTVTLFSADTTDNRLQIINVKDSENLSAFISKLVEKERMEKGIMGKEMIGADDAAHDCADTAGDLA